VRRGVRPLVLFDAELPDPCLAELARSPARAAADPVAVRMRPTRSCRAHRERLHTAGLPAVVLDARAVLAEGDAFDVSDPLDAVRLARVASKLRAAGFAVVAIVHRGQLPPEVDGFAACAAHELAELTIPAEPLAARPPATGPTGGNRVELELDNGRARRWLLDAIAGARATLHFQVYMAADDDVGEPVEAALAAAGARGVRVRALVDSLHGLHGSFGTQNPLLARLAARPGVELRVGRPLSELPSLVDLKQRDHRKLAMADGRIALIGGRNLSHEYYTGFNEVAIMPASRWREVPWLDAGARVEGPAVAALEAAFRDAWREAGGDDFPVVVPAPAGSTPVRVVVHHGLRDARTLEAYRALIDGARSHIEVVNGFPFVLELQHALVHALRRGVRVRVLTGRLTPTHDGKPFSGPMSAARTAATELVHSRLDPIVAAGGDIYLFARCDVPGWAAALGLVHTHVHAKALSVDGRACAVGSANLDITASYWESEAMLVVEDVELVRGFEAQIDALMAASTRVDREDATWQRLAQRRAWMRHWPGVLSI
jgi:phosphatidylserine/phosphatidylglycerophosphate/cardiolipin synthase-like enzyme